MRSHLIVQKYGGTSLGSLEKIRGLAKRIKKSRDAGKNVLVVVSAMAGETDKLLAMAHELSDLPERREIDLLLSSGERISSALLSIALHGMGCSAVALTGRKWAWSLTTRTPAHGSKQSTPAVRPMFSRRITSWSAPGSRESTIWAT